MHVRASGGTAPYSGTGDFIVNGGRSVFTVTDAHGCSTSQAIVISNGTGDQPGKPLSILGEAADATGLCGGGDFSYSVAAVVNATSYTWMPPAACTIKSVSKDGTQITLGVPPNFTTGTLSVTANNFCGSSTPQTKALTNLPGRPGVISGPVSVSALQSGLIYKVPAVPGLTYDWGVPPGAKIMSGQNTPAIKVNWGTVAGNVNVKAVNSCGSSLNSILSVTVTSLAATQQNIPLDPYLMPLNIVVSPNPTKDIAQLLFTSEAAIKYTVTLTDNNGKLLMHKTGITVSGENVVSMDVHNYANGIFVVKLIASTGEIKRTKFLKQ